MAITYLFLFIFALVLACIVNVVRFRVSSSVNRYIVLGSVLVLIEMEGYVSDYVHTAGLLYVFIALSVYSLGVWGGGIGLCISWAIDQLQYDSGIPMLKLKYLIFAGGAYLFFRYLKQRQLESDRWLSKLTENSKQLNVFKEISLTMQQTLNLDQLLRTVLTSVTAGYGLGFNRAIILLIDETGQTLIGKVGTGPMTAEEGYATWDRINKHKYKLKDLIQIKEEDRTADQPLNERVTKIKVPLNEPHFLSEVLDSGVPMLYSEQQLFNGNRDQLLRWFLQEFNSQEMGVIPLIGSGTKVGVLLIDNPTHKRPITANDMDTVLPLANQAAIAIQQILLFSRAETMALRDGLTGLFNQRAFQSTLHEFWKHPEQLPLSLILIDIDYFKHFNDTNGHLLGNEVLIQVADILLRSVREKDKAFRFGGEEFVILLPATDRKEAAVVAERIRQNIELTVFPCGDRQPSGRLTVSLGVSCSSFLPKELRTPNQLIEIADQALYKAKAFGRNKVIS